MMMRIMTMLMITMSSGCAPWNSYQLSINLAGILRNLICKKLYLDKPGIIFLSIPIVIEYIK